MPLPNQATIHEAASFPFPPVRLSQKASPTSPSWAGVLLTRSMIHALRACVCIYLLVCPARLPNTSMQGQVSCFTTTLCFYVRCSVNICWCESLILNAGIPFPQKPPAVCVLGINYKKEGFFFFFSLKDFRAAESGWGAGMLKAHSPVSLDASWCARAYVSSKTLGLSRDEPIPWLSSCKAGSTIWSRNQGYELVEEQANGSDWLKVTLTTPVAFSEKQQTFTMKHSIT